MIEARTAAVPPARGTARERFAGWRTTPSGRVGTYVASVAAVVGLYYLAARLGLAVRYQDGTVAAIWPPVGVAVAALFVLGLRVVPGVVIGDMLPGVADYSQPLGTVLGQTLGNTVSAVLAALLLRRLTEGRASLDRVTDVAAFVACAIIAAGVSALFGPPSLWLGDVIPGNRVDDVFRTWFLSDLSGALVVTPFLLVWARGGITRAGRRYVVESAAVLGLLVFLAEVPSQRDVPYIVFPVLIWAAVRLGPRGAASAILLVATLTIWNTAQDEGPFNRDSITDSLLATQLFIAIAALTSLVLAAVRAERARAEERQRILAGEQAALRRVATLVASEVPASELFAKVTEEAACLLGAATGSVVRYGPDGTATVVGGWSRAGMERVPDGSTVAPGGDTVVARVYRTGEPQYLESYEELDDPFGDMLRSFGYRSAVGAPIKLGGEMWGAVVVATAHPDPLPPDSERRLCDFAELVAQAIANADAREKLAASRARIVEAGDAERRRLERNLHDGAQQRLVALALQLRLIDAKLGEESAAARPLLAAAHEQLDQALDELRELARGIHPAVLSDRGLAAALETLASRAPLPVEVDSVPEERLPEAVEAAAYYVVAEAVTNAAKYARASRVSVAVRRADGAAYVRVADDGIGGADPARGTGLRGLADRVEAFDGRLRVVSSPGGGTQVEAEIPLPRASDGASASPVAEPGEEAAAR